MQYIQAGPLVRRLKSFPMLKFVAGQWADLSEYLHEMLGVFARARAEASVREEEGGQA